MFHQVDLTDAKLEKEFGMGCLTIKGAHLWPLSHFVWEASAKEVSATFFGEDEEPWDQPNLLRIEVFRLPRAKDRLAERLKWYSRSRKKRRIKISDGELFDESMLHVKGLAKEWEQDSFALSKAEIIRLYQGKRHAVILRFLARSGSLLEHPVFKRVIRNVQYDETEWVTEVPEILDTRPKSQRTKETPLTDEQESEMWQVVGAAMKRLKLSKVKDAAKRLATVEKEIEAAREDKTLKSKSAVMDRAIELGTLVGQVFCWDLDWEWCNVRDADGSESICVGSPDRSMAIAPVDWIFDLMTDKKRALNCVLAFNMITAGRTPPSRPNAYARIG